MRVKKFSIIQLEHRQIDSRSDGLDRGGYFISGLIRLDLHLAGIIHDMGVGQDALAFNYHTTVSSPFIAPSPEFAAPDACGGASGNSQIHLIQRGRPPEP